MESMEKLFEDFIEQNNLGLKKTIDHVCNITSSQFDEIRRHLSVEAFLNCIVNRYGCLLHGSTRDFYDRSLKSDHENKIYATNLGSIALLTAVISSEHLRSPGLQYPFNISELTPLEVKVHGMKSGTVKEYGFVYLIKDTALFVNHPQGSWQFVMEDVKKNNEFMGAPVVAKLQVLRTDFKYPVFDVDNNVRVPLE
jgi:hypothetical protein